MNQKRDWEDGSMVEPELNRDDIIIYIRNYIYLKVIRNTKETLSKKSLRMEICLFIGHLQAGL